MGGGGGDGAVVDRDKEIIQHPPQTESVQDRLITAITNCAAIRSVSVEKVGGHNKLDERPARRNGGPNWTRSFYQSGCESI